MIRAMTLDPVGGSSAMLMLARIALACAAATSCAAIPTKVGRNTQAVAQAPDAEPGQEIVRTRPFGVRCDSVTDDYSALSAAIAALPTRGGIVEVQPGTCLLNLDGINDHGPLSIPSNVTLRGLGKNGSVTLKYTGTGIGAIIEQDATHAVLENLKVWATKSNALVLRATDGHTNEWATARNVQLQTDHMASAAVYLSGGAGKDGYGIVYWPNFWDCELVGPGTSQSAGVRTSSTGNGVINLRVYGGRTKRFGRHFDLRNCASALVLGTSMDGAVAACPITHVDPLANTMTCNKHGLVDGDVVQIASSEKVPLGIATENPYYVIGATADALQLSALPSGTAVDLLNQGAGMLALSLVGRYIYLGRGAVSDTFVDVHLEGGTSVDRVVEFADGSADNRVAPIAPIAMSSLVGARVGTNSNSTDRFTQAAAYDSNVNPYPTTFARLLEDVIYEKTGGRGTTIGSAILKTKESEFTANVNLTGAARLLIASGAIARPDGAPGLLLGNGTHRIWGNVETLPAGGDDKVIVGNAAGGQVTTTGTAPMTLFTYTTPPNSAVSLTIDVMGYRIDGASAGERAFFTRQIRGGRVGSNPATIDQVATVGNDRNEARFGGVAVEASSATVLVAVRGLAGATIKWAATTRYEVDRCD